MSQLFVQTLRDTPTDAGTIRHLRADLLGMPLRVVVGERGLKNGVIELKQRRESEVETIAAEDWVQRVLDHFQVRTARALTARHFMVYL
jgi:prolyl-tRNA synthetase